MTDFTITQQQKRSLAVATVVALLFGAYFLSSFFKLIVLAAILAYLFSPLYRKFLKRMGKGSASALTLTISILVIIIPFFLVIVFAGVQLKDNISSISSLGNTANIGNFGDKAIVSINNTLNSIPYVNVNVTEQSIVDALKKVLQNFSGTALDFTTGLVSSAASIITATIIYMYVFISLLRNSDKLILIFRKLNPLGEKISDLYLSKMSAMVQGTVKGQIIIAIVQAFLGALTIALVGFPQYFFVLFILFALLSIIPLGAGIVTIPLGIILALFGNVIAGAIVILQHLLISTNVDNVLRPILVPKQARLDTALMLLSVFAGIQLFGFLGIVIGPTLMILVVTTVRVYLDVYTDYKPAVNKKNLEKNRSKFWNKKSIL